MIIDNQKSDVLEVVGEQTARTATINTNKIKKLQYILTEGLYKDAMSATIVELANNGVDAIVESGKDPIQHPVIVELKSANREYSLSIKDEGIGMSKDFFENFFMDMLSSTKEDNDEAIGHFGIGGKSWASLKRAVTFTITKDGQRCKYLCYKGEEMIDFDLIYEEETDEPNGVLFEMSINDQWEFNDFCSKARQKLAYYDTVVLIINGVIWENKIYRNELFQYTLNPPFDTLHICLKDVVYDIDFSKLGIPPIYLPVAIRFGLSDNIAPTPSRESILYGRDTIEILQNKIAEVATYFGEKWNDSISTPLKFIDAYPLINNWRRDVELTDKIFEVHDLLKYASIPINDFSVEGVALKTPKWYKDNIYLLMECLHLKAEYTSRGVWKTARLYTNLGYKFERKEKVILTDDLRGNVKEYLKELVGKSSLFVSEARLPNLSWYRRNVVGTVPKELWRKHIQEWQAVQEQIIKDFCIDYRGVENTQAYLDWLDKYKQWRKDNKDKIASTYKTLDKQEGEVTIAYGRAPLLGNSYVFEKATFKLKDVPKTPHLVITFRPDEIEKARELAAIVKKQKVAIIGVRERTKIEATQFKTYEEFMGDCKPFRRIATSILIDKVLKTYRAVSRDNEIIQNCLKSVAQDIKDLTTYKYDNYTEVQNDVSIAISDLAKDLNLYDEEIMPILRRVEKALETFAFIEHLAVPRAWEEEKKKEITRLINQMLLFRKKYYNELENCEIIYKEKVQEEEPELV